MHTSKSLAAPSHKLEDTMERPAPTKYSILTQDTKPVVEILERLDTALKCHAGAREGSIMALTRTTEGLLCSLFSSCRFLKPVNMPRSPDMGSATMTRCRSCPAYTGGAAGPSIVCADPPGTDAALRSMTRYLHAVLTDPAARHLHALRTSIMVDPAGVVTTPTRLELVEDLVEQLLDIPPEELEERLK